MKYVLILSNGLQAKTPGICSKWNKIDEQNITNNITRVCWFDN